MEKQNHIRINNTILGPLERPALNWLADHMPAWVMPDHLTALGLFASLIIFFAYSATTVDAGFLWLASFGFVLNWFGDSLDGTLARKRHIERPLYGFFIDHIIDALSTLLIFLGLGFSPLVRFEFALLALIGYLLLSIYTYLSTYTNHVFQISFSGLGPTEIRFIALVVNTVIFFAGNPHFKINFLGESLFTIFDVTALIIALILFIMFLVSSFSTAAVLRKKDNAELAKVPEK